MAKTVAPYGSWRSPISIEQCAAAGDPWFTYAVVDLAADGLTWIEPRAAEEGRAVLVHRRADGFRAELTPRGFDARTRVHEYGGGAAWRHGDTFFFSHFGDGRVYRVDGLEGEPRPVTPEPAEPNALRYADGRVSPDGSTVFCVREQHGAGVVNDLVSFPADGSAAPRVVATGRDFYAAPRVGPDGRLAYPRLGRPAASVHRHRALGRRRADRGRRRRVDLPAGVGPGRRAPLGLRPRRLVEPLPRRRAAHRAPGRARLPAMGLRPQHATAFSRTGASRAP